MVTIPSFSRAYSANYPEIKRITQLDRISEGPTYAYLLSDKHDVGREIATQFAENPGIVVVNCTNADESAYVEDEAGRFVGIDVVLPSAFETLRSRHPEAVSELVDLPYVCGSYDWVAVIVLLPGLKAEYGAVPVAALPAAE